MRIFGHPIHIMLVHFPSALFPMDAVCYLLYYLNGQLSFGTASFYAVAGGVALGWAAILFGALDLIKIPGDKPLVLQKALIHGAINCMVVIVYTVIFYSLYKKYPVLPAANLALAIAKICIVGFMIAGNYIGGSLILKDKLGIKA